MALRPPKPAPRCDTSENSVAMLVVPDASGLSAATLDLAQQDTLPSWSPQKLTLSNGTAAALAVVLTDEDGKAHTISVPAQNYIVITRPIRLITDAGSGAVQVVAEWFDPNGSTHWNV